jgi:hypothetical protein
MRRTMFMLVLMGTTLALAAGVVLAQEDPRPGAVTTREPNEFILNAVDCAGEEILVTGQLHSVFHVTEDPETGRLHVNVHFNFSNVKGIGKGTGVEYIVPTTVNSIQTLTSAGQLVSTDVSMSNTIGQGRAANQQTTAVIHFTIHEDGTVTSEVAHFRFECKQ